MEGIVDGGAETEGVLRGGRGRGLVGVSALGGGRIVAGDEFDAGGALALAMRGLGFAGGGSFAVWLGFYGNVAV